jgi:hypothetical protein
MRRSVATFALPVIAVLCFASSGCGRGSPELGRVEGTVTLDGKPLAGARIEFQPQITEVEDASPSYATSDESGRYELIYGVGQKGAMIGRHSVSISTGADYNDGEGMVKSIPERVPPRYNSETELTRDVEPGSNTIDFELEGAISE